MRPAPEPRRPEQRAAERPIDPAGRGEVTGAVAAGRAGAGAAAAGADRRARTAGAETDGAVTGGVPLAWTTRPGWSPLASRPAVPPPCRARTRRPRPGGRRVPVPERRRDGRGATEPGRPGPPVGALLGAADPLVGRSAFAPAGLVAGNASRSLRTTGASMVEDGDLTNSPIWLSFAMISLLVLPSSFASSCTRALPATALLRVRAAAGSERPLALRCAGCCSLLLHGVLTLGRPAF